MVEEPFCVAVVDTNGGLLVVVRMRAECGRLLAYLLAVLKRIEPLHRQPIEDGAKYTDAPYLQ